MPRLLLSSFYGVVGLQKRSVPKIGGSESAFITIIVFFAAIVMFSCVRVYFLWRNHGTSDQDRALRHRNERRQHPSISSSSPFIYNTTAGVPQPISKFRWRSLFSRGGDDQKHAAHGKPGWVKAGSGDWDTEDEGQGGKDSMRSPEMDQFPTNVGNPPIANFPVSESSTSVHFETRRSPARYTPISRSPVSIPMIATRVSSSPQSSPPSFPVLIRSSSPEPIPGSIEDTSVSYHKEERKESGQSRASVWTFEGGTKFIESL